MPKPIVCLSEQLRQFAEIFRCCFSQRQWKYFVMVLLGLIECEERKTLSGLRRVIGEQVSLCGLSRFLNKWHWSPAEVAQRWLLHFRQRMETLVDCEHTRLKAQQPKRIGRPKQTVVTGFLIFDDSVHHKPKDLCDGFSGRVNFAHVSGFGDAGTAENPSIYLCLACASVILIFDDQDSRALGKNQTTS